jgi:RNA polymerase sigma factor (sigma-70 family)
MEQAALTLGRLATSAIRGQTPDRRISAASADSGQDRLTDTVRRERGRLLRFIRARVADIDDADDVLQDVLCELTEATRLMRPIEHAGAWLFAVARNRITDLYRKRRPTVSLETPAGDRGEESGLVFEDLLPSPDAGPHAAYARQVLLDELGAAIDDLPDDQREVFVAHEIEGRSFRDLAAETGVNVNTLLARKHYAVRRLRRRLRAIHDEFSQA